MLQRGKMSMKDFYKDLRKFQMKYPMCYVEAWTPERKELKAEVVRLREAISKPMSRAEFGVPLTLTATEVDAFREALAAKEDAK